MASKLSSASLAVSIKPLLQRAFLLVLLAFSLLLVFSERSENGLAKGVRSILMEGVVPVMDVLSQPVIAAEELSYRWTKWTSVYEENQQLRADNMRLMEWRAAAVKLELENQSLRQLMHYQPDQAQAFISARVINHTSNRISQQLTIDAGAKQGVKVNQAVMNEKGLIGRVISVSPNAANILLITDMNARIPVVISPHGVRAILAGNRSGVPQLKFMHDKGGQLQAGDQVVSAPDGDVFPAGLPVGHMLAQHRGQWDVQPFVDFGRIDYVRVADFTRHP